MSSPENSTCLTSSASKTGFFVLHLLLRRIAGLKISSLQSAGDALFLLDLVMEWLRGAENINGGVRRYKTRKCKIRENCEVSACQITDIADSVKKNPSKRNDSHFLKSQWFLHS